MFETLPEVDKEEHELYEIVKEALLKPFRQSTKANTYQNHTDSREYDFSAVCFYAFKENLDFY